MPDVEQEPTGDEARMPDVAQLVARLRQALDEEERIARACPPWPWRIEYDDEIYAGPGRCHGVLLDANENTPTVVVPVPYGEVGPQHEHIVRHDPARVLRQVAVHRTILDAYESAQHSMGCVRFGDWQSCSEVDLHEFIRILANIYGLQDAIGDPE